VLETSVARHHPNDLDRRRIERALESRKRYRYVSPCVVATADGYRIESPCCSRNVDPDGGIIDVALLVYASDLYGWHLYRKDHVSGNWCFSATYARLQDLLDYLNADPDRQFWQ